MSNEKSKTDRVGAATSLLETLLSSQDALVNLPGAVIMRTDIDVCLKDAITDSFPVKREEIGPDFTPSKKPAVADSGGWGICLTLYASYLSQLRPVYQGYRHRPIYDRQTLDEEYLTIIGILHEALLEQLKPALG